MDAEEAFLHAAFEALKTLVPQNDMPRAWKEAADSPGGAPLVKRVLADLGQARRRLLARLVEAEDKMEVAHRAAAEFLAGAPVSPPSSSPPITGPTPPAGLAIVPDGEADKAPPEPSPAPDEPPSLALLNRLETLKKSIEGLPLDPADLAFIDKSQKMVAGLKDGDVGMEAKILYNSVWQLEGIRAKYGGWMDPGDLGLFQDLHETLEEFVNQLGTRLAELGFALFPSARSGTWTDLAETEGKDALQSIALFSSKPKGEVLGVFRSGVRKEDGTVAEKAHVMASLGPMEAAEAIGRAVKALLGIRPRDAKDQAHLGKGVKELWKYLENLPGQPDGYTFVRYAVNVLHDRNGKNRLKSAVRELVSFLENGGYQEILVPLGETFDESFSPSKYERKRVPSDRPPGTILKVARRGFMDPKGVPIQKAMVEISKG